MRQFQRPTLAFAAAALAVGLSLAAAAPASAAPASTTGASAASHRAASPSSSRGRSAGDYLALGDSVPFGYSPLVPAGSPARDYVGYPRLAAPLLHLALTNLSCPGETTGSFLDATAPDNGCRAFRSAAPLHASYAGTQAQAALAFLASHPRTRLVTLMIGANDLFLCGRATADGCAAPSELAATLAGVRTNLQRILDAVRAHYGGRLVLVTYYSTDYTDAMTTRAIGALDGVVAEQAAAHRARVADGLSAFAAISAVAGGHTCSAGLLIRLPSGGCDVHPSRFGAGVLAATVVRAA